MIITRRLLGLGHSTCKPLPVPTQDGPNRYSKFKLRRIRRDYWNVLCMADSQKLRKTATELIQNYRLSNKSLKYLEFTQDYSGESKKQKNLPVPTIVDVAKGGKEDELSGESEHLESLDRSDGSSVSENDVIGKSRGFWIVYSKRFKESMHLLKVSDIATILKSFHLYNRDSGEYVVAILELQRRVEEMDGRTLLDCLWVLSRRIKRNTQKEFFRSIANQVPNVLYSMSAFDIVNLLWNLYNAGYKDVEICRRVYPKFMDHMEDLSEQDLSAACLAFGRFGYRNMKLLSKIESMISKNCNADTLFQMAWGLHMSAVDVTNLVSERTETLVNSLEDAPRWKVEVWKTILDSTNCSSSLKKTVYKYL